VIPPWLRRALVARDRTCRWPGCDRPASWLDGHHLRHWVDGGETKLTNTALVCRRHHMMLHEGGYRLVLDAQGQAHVIPPAARPARGP
jgi:hypothetical protein